jgi:ubiquinone/menaquinone biosynthesis C-methylase UbiE
MAVPRLVFDRAILHFSLMQCGPVASFVNESNKPVRLGQGTIAATQEDAKMTEAEAKMFSMSAEYERFMGRWSRLLAQGYIAFAGVKNGDHVLDVGTGTGSLAAAIETMMTSGEIVGIDPSEGFISYAKKNAKSGHARFEVGDAQALRFRDASFDQTMALLVMNFVPRSQ